MTTGWANIAAHVLASYPSGSTDAGEIDDLLRELNTDLVDGFTVEHSGGDDDEDFQGMHRFPADASLPTATARPAGHLFFQSGIADTLFPWRNAGSAYSAVGCAFKTLASGNTGSLASSGTHTVNLGAYAAAHGHWILSLYAPLPSANNPLIILGPPGFTAAVFGYIERDPAGNDMLKIANNTSNAEVIYYSVRQLVG